MPNGDSRDLLCELCQNLSLSSIPEKVQVMMQGDAPSKSHHSSFQTLESSARTGCPYCRLFLRAVLDVYMQRTHWPEDKVIEYHQWLDRTNAGGFSITFDVWPHQPGHGDHKSEIIGLQYQRRMPYDRIPQRGRAISGAPDGVFESFSDVYVVPRLSLVSRSGQHPSVVGRLVPDHLKVQAAAEWIDVCSRSHSKCGAVEEQALPSRLLDIAQIGDGHLRLIETTGLKGTYVTLSHCWGNFQPLTTTTKTLAAHLRGISRGDMPLTFQDACTVTWELGYRYLWIDSLCIIQDSAEDWQRECSRMAQIYQKSAVTLAGPAAASPYAGFLHHQYNPPISPCHFPDNDMDNDLLLALPATSYNGLSLSLLEPRSPMASRAWILQERLLSPRVLFFGSEQIYFECCTQQSFGCSWVPLSEESHGAVVESYLPKHCLYHMQGNHFQYWNWSLVVSNYTACRLSKPSDKLPALSGLAQMFTEILDDQYLAGLWKKDLAVGLLWRLDTSSTGSPHQQLEGQYIAPSWSWASHSGLVMFNDTLRNFANEAAVFDVLGSAIHPLGHNQFGELAPSSLTLSARLIAFTASPANNDGRIGLLDQSCVSNVTAFFRPDGRCNSGFQSGELVEVVLLYYIGRSTSHMWAGLVVEKGDSDPPHYRRIARIEGRVDQATDLSDFASRSAAVRRWLEMEKTTIILV